MVPEGKPPYRFWVKLAKTVNKEFEHRGLSATNSRLAHTSAAHTSAAHTGTHERRKEISSVEWSGDISSGEEWSGVE